MRVTKMVKDNLPKVTVLLPPLHQTAPKIIPFLRSVPNTPSIKRKSYYPFSSNFANKNSMKVVYTHVLHTEVCMASLD